MLGVGIHENLVASKSVKNDKGTLVFTLKQVADLNPLDVLNSGTNSVEEKDFMIYPPTVQENDDYDKVLAKVIELRTFFEHILSQYMTKSSIKWDMSAGTGLTNETIKTKLVDQVMVDKIYSNLVDQFNKQMSPYLGDTGKKLRWIFVRQSKAKHFPALRRRFLDSQPIVEPMSVPRSASKLKFSKYEIDNGLNSGEQITGQQTPSEAEASEVDSLLSI